MVEDHGAGLILPRLQFRPAACGKIHSEGEAMTQRTPVALAHPSCDGANTALRRSAMSKSEDNMAAGSLRAGLKATVFTLAAGTLALALAGCQSNEPLAFDPSVVQPSASSQPAPKPPVRNARQQPVAAVSDGSDERPAFFLEWKGGDLPGLTQKPALDRQSEMPEYPANSIRNREQGTTVLNACVTVDGRLVDVHLAKSSGYPRLDEATVEWAKKAKYKPAMFGEEALAVCNFRLEWVWQFRQDTRG
jgi:TonB family protein